MGTCCVSPWNLRVFVSEGRGINRGFSGFSPRLIRKACTISSRPAKLRVVIHCEQSPTRATAGNAVRASDSERILVEECLNKVSFATGVSRSNVNQHFTVSGKQYLFGMEGEWSLSWCTDGRFYEKYGGQEITYEWGFDGVHNPWFADFAGRVTALELDDLEIAQLAVFVRTGFWLTDNAQNRLDIQIEGEDSFKALRQQFGELVLSVHLRDRKLSFSHKFPHSCVHYPAEGGIDSYTVKYSTLNSGGGNSAKDEVETDYMYAFPKTSIVPRSNKYYPQASLDSNCDPAVKMVRARSGHLLVRPLIDGKDIGYFLLDTGASGLGICQKQAEQLCMESFGELYMTSFDGLVKSRFCRGKNFQLGPLTIKSPFFLEVDIHNFIVDVEPIVGVCGFDVFYNSIVKISCKEDKFFLLDTSHYEDKCQEPLKWERIFFLKNVPNISAKINGKQLILLLDTGGSGVDVIFHSKAEKYGNLQTDGQTNIRGISSTGEANTVHRAVIDKLEIAGHCFKQVNAVYVSGGSTQLHLSEYTSGILCMNLLTRFTIVFDYRNSRVSLIDMKFDYYNN
ncbi:uncharacterized protein LOC131029744 isoform X2 [Cryptomeria japonica]|uniref:uncharacterized protein LOC131029744 isoform X2 n=1 Tax=Cryptomeria japonica TaxID=3369 RepID=UPI0025AD77A4|nr:uncharacterized protein LOC131029744 isoform X2 [Cryptomeria japonica]